MSMSTAEIRQAFLDYFGSKGHEVVASSSLVPHNDPTLLFTNAGMNQFKNIFLGTEQSHYNKATSAQRCVRAGGKHNDLENVGYTARHHTFFEMLGNFSFGDYFKRDAIQYAWEFLTSQDWLNIPKDKLLVTVYATDDEAYDIWLKDIGIAAERIIRIGDNKGSPYASDNFWQMGDSGPCGPCTEIFYDHGEAIWGGVPGSPEEEGDRYIEIWNLVFMQFNRQTDGSMQPLPKPSVDTGMGLERIAAVIQHVHNNYEIDLFKMLIGQAADIIGVQERQSKSLRVIADHIRACAFLIADGVLPSNEGRGYVLRRIIRRAIRHGHLLGTKEVFFYKLVAPLIQIMSSAAECLKSQQQVIEQVLKLEEEQFIRTLERGLQLLDHALADLKSGDVLEGKIVFRLYDTFGFPFDLTEDICRERNIQVDSAEFESAMAEQRQRARSSSQFNIDYASGLKTEEKSDFLGYQQTQLTAPIVAIFHDNQPVKMLKKGEKGSIILEKTPFYAESGGQVGDSGFLITERARFQVTDTQKMDQAILHFGKVIEGKLTRNESVSAEIDVVRRNNIRANHTATHLLHAALRKSLGTHIMQKGSLVNEHYLRFDFAHFEPITFDTLFAIEGLVNQKIRENLPVKTKIMDLDVAKAQGAIALFGEKYDNMVRVLEIEDFSTELCGGTHVETTGNIGLFHIIAESSIAAGVRRIEAVTGESALLAIQQKMRVLHNIAYTIKSDIPNLDKKVQGLWEQNKLLEKELYQLKEQNAVQLNASLLDQVVDIKGIKLLVSQLKGVEPKIMRTLVDDLKNQLGSGIIVLATIYENSISLTVGVTSDLTTRVRANELIASIAQSVGGKGGGRPDMAQAGGGDIAALPKALSSIQSWIIAKL